MRARGAGGRRRAGLGATGSQGAGAGRTIEIASRGLSLELERAIGRELAVRPDRVAAHVFAIGDACVATAGGIRVLAVPAAVAVVAAAHASAAETCARDPVSVRVRDPLLNPVNRVARLTDEVAAVGTRVLTAVDRADVVRVLERAFAVADVFCRSARAARGADDRAHRGDASEDHDARNEHGSIRLSMATQVQLSGQKGAERFRRIRAE